MSGGVDSSVAAARLVEQGHDVVGATLKLWGGSSDSGCCSVSDVEDARRVAQQVGIDHHVFNYSEEFDRLVVDPFVEGYRRATSPNPCIECNRTIKFDLLAERAWRLGFDALATGHHARVVRRGANARLARGADERKDQSYVLGYLSADVLERLMLPVGDLTKDGVRAEAARLGLRTWDKPDSQDVCFIEQSRGRAAFLGDRIALTPADVVDATTGEHLGTTEAAELMTVGQRRGIAPDRDGERRFVRRVDLEARRVEVGRLSEVSVTSIELDPSSLTYSTTPLESGSSVLAQWSAHGVPQPARFVIDGGYRLELERPVRPVAAGQSAVLYEVEDHDVVIGAALVRSR